MTYTTMWIQAYLSCTCSPGTDTRQQADRLLKCISIQISSVQELLNQMQPHVFFDKSSGICGDSAVCMDTPEPGIFTCYCFIHRQQSCCDRADQHYRKYLSCKPRVCCVPAMRCASPTGRWCTRMVHRPRDGVCQQDKMLTQLMHRSIQALSSPPELGLQPLCMCITLQLFQCHS